MWVGRIGAITGLFATISMIPAIAGASPFDVHPAPRVDQAGAPRSNSSSAPSSGTSENTASAGSGSSSPSKVVKMSDDDPMYSPSEVQIVAGQTIEWQNTGEVSHSVTDDPSHATNPVDALVPKGVKPFNSGSVMPGGNFQHTFTVPGRYRYFCLTHEMDKMVGEVLVTPAQTASPTQVSTQHTHAPSTMGLSSATPTDVDP